MKSEKDLELWYEQNEVTPERRSTAVAILAEVRAGVDVVKAARKRPLKEGGYVPKSVLVAVYHELVESGEWLEEPGLLARIRMKPVRTLSGVTTVTVLTKPYPCPGKCVFCPTDARMPKSYLPDEPGAMRGVQNHFDPYLQVKSRLDSLTAVGHPTDKIELLILGGTWSAYRKDYQEWFVKRCFEAMNESEQPTLEAAHSANENGLHRCVGLVIETRPDEITGKKGPLELAWLRRLGVTKVQMGAQSLDDRILELNQRGHSVADTIKAVTLLRAAGFKVVLHWMPNLLGATTLSDRADYTRLWQAELGGLGLCPDELKIYPCQLLANAELYDHWQRGEYTPYTQQELVNLIADVKPSTPVYCRINRVIRDIPSTHVVEGNRRTSLRMDVFDELKQRGQACRCIRCREVKDEQIDTAQLSQVDLTYQTPASEEHFIQFVTPSDRIAGYLRLSLPGIGSPDLSEALPDLKGAALIREVHVYGQALAVGEELRGAAQHAGLGTRLLNDAERIAKERGFERLVVISAVGTRLYYEGRGFTRGQHYLVKELSQPSPGES